MHHRCSPLYHTLPRWANYCKGVDENSTQGLAFLATLSSDSDEEDILPKRRGKRKRPSYDETTSDDEDIYVHTGLEEDAAVINVNEAEGIHMC